MAHDADADLLSLAHTALLKRLQILDKEADGVRLGADPEAVHRMRVAARRLRCALVLFADHLPPKKCARWLKETRRLTRALGAARDTDVQLAFLDAVLQRPRPELAAATRPGIVRLRLRLQQRRQRQQVKVVAALDRWQAHDVPSALAHAHARHADAPTPSQQIAERLAHVQALAACVDHPEQVAELHALRIAVKHLRYAMEFFAPLYGEPWLASVATIRTFQEQLGAVHDCDVWQEFLPVFAADERARTLRYFGDTRAFHRLQPGLAYLQADRAAQRQACFAAFSDSWQRSAADQLWRRLDALR